MNGWTCRRCANGDHRACEQEVRGLSCVCQCLVVDGDDSWHKRKARYEEEPDREACLSCYYISCHGQCINHSCGMFSAHHELVTL